MVCLYSMLAFVMCFAQGKCDGYCDNDTIGLLQDRKTSVPTKNQIAALQPTAPPRFQWSKPVFPPIQCGSSHGDAKLSFFKNITYWRSKDQSHQTTIPLNCENLCGQHLSGQLVYFGVGSCDGLGGALGSMIFHLAVAYKHSFRFGGMVFANCTRDAEYKNKISGMLGINYDNIVLAGDGPFSFKTCLHPDSDVDNLQHVGYRDGPLIYDYHSYGLTANAKDPKAKAMPKAPVQVVEGARSKAIPPLKPNEAAPVEPAEEKTVVVVSPEPGTEDTAKPEGQTEEKVQDKEIEKAKEEKPKDQVEDKPQEMKEDKKEDEKEEEEGKPGQDNKKDDLEELGEESSEEESAPKPQSSNATHVAKKKKETKTTEESSEESTYTRKRRLRRAEKVLDVLSNLLEKKRKKEKK